MGTNILVYGDDRVTYQVCLGDDARSEFIDKGHLADSVDTHYRPINDLTPAFAFSHHIGNVSKYNSSQEYVPVARMLI